MKDGPSFGGMARGLWFAYQAANTIEDRAEQKRARRDAQRRLEEIEKAEISGKLQDARLADFSDVAAANLLDPSGLYLGMFKDGKGANRLIFYNGDGSLLTYGYPGSGKGRDIILPNLAHIKHSVVVTDPKGELAYATGGFRKKLLRGSSIYANPWGLENLPRHKLNPLSALIDRAASGLPCIDEAREFATIFMPENSGGGENAWVRDAARKLLQLRLVFTAKYEPENCTPGGLWDFFNSGKLGYEAQLKHMAEFDDPFVSAKAKAFLQNYPGSGDTTDQIGWVLDDADKCVELYAPGSAVREATSKSDFDLGDLKRKPHSLYLIIPGGKLDSHGQWLALMVNAAIEKVAGTPGNTRTTFILDEFSNLPKMPGALKALRLYRSEGVQLWPFVHGRESLEGSPEMPRYGQSGRRMFESQSQVWQMWGVGDDDQLCKELEHQAGYKSVVVHGESHSGGTVQSGTRTRNEQVTPVLPASEIRKIDKGQQILSIKGGFPLFVGGRAPWWELAPWNKQIRNPHGRHS